MTLFEMYRRPFFDGPFQPPLHEGIDPHKLDIGKCHIINMIQFFGHNWLDQSCSSDA